MSEVYEYRHAGRKSAIWLIASVTAFVLGIALVNLVPEVKTAMWAIAAIILLWSLTVKPIAGIRVDDDHLILSAWRKPRLIPLSDIAYLQSTHWDEACQVTIVMKDGTEQKAHACDMPPACTLAHVMAERGIAVLDPALRP